MAETSVPSNAQVQLWDSDYFKEFINRNYFKKFEGTGASSLIQVKEDLTSKPGGTVTMHLVNKLTGTAKNYYETLEGAEEDVMLRTHDISIREYSHAVRWAKFQEQLTAIDLRKAHKETLMDWNMELDRDNIIRELGSIDGTAYSLASEASKDSWLANNADRVLFGAATSNNSGNDHSASLANVDTTSDKLSPDIIGLMKRMAKSATPKVRPVMARSNIGDVHTYIIFAGTRAIRDLRANSTYQQQLRDAAPREKAWENPIFTGADLVVDNCPVYEIEDIPVYTGVGNSSADVSPVYLLGAQALGKVWAMRPTTVDDEFDYKRKHGLAIKQWYEISKMRFGTGSTDTSTKKDHGIVTAYVAAASD